MYSQNSWNYGDQRGHMVYICWKVQIERIGWNGCYGWKGWKGWNGWNGWNGLNDWNVWESIRL